MLLFLADYTTVKPECQLGIFGAHVIGGMQRCLRVGRSSFRFVDLPLLYEYRVVESRFLVFEIDLLRRLLSSIIDTRLLNL